ncbi:hypothetical protein MMC29_000690 [Sticta canariensis]|nr:hypothetical protein [Sticta canariensis]
MDTLSSSQGKTTKVCSHREKRMVTRGAKKNKKVNGGTNVSSSAPQPPINNGKTRMVDGAMEYKSHNGWIPAIFHDDIRAQLLAEAPQGTYDVPRERGKGVNDITSFHPAYKTYGPDRKNRHKILFRYVQDGYPVPSKTPETWMYRGKIVLDPSNDPVQKWDEIPLVLSSAYEGYDMEVVRRLNPKISFRDFRARMPRSFMKGETRKKAWASSTLSMRNSRFRLAACCLAWDNREGSDTLKEYLDMLLPPECIAANSTEGFRDLTAYEVKEAKAGNKGKYLNRAGAQALDQTTRQQRDEVEQQRSRKLLNKHNEIVRAPPLAAIVNPACQSEGRKRKRAESALGSEDEEEDTCPLKRQKRPANLDLRLRDAENPGHGASNFRTGPANQSVMIWLDQVSQPTDHSQVPVLPVEYQSPVEQEFGFGEDDMASEGGCWQSEDRSIYAEQPTPQNGPYYLNHAQLQAFARAQVPDWERDFCFG